MSINALAAFGLLCLLNSLVPGPNTLLVLRAQVVGARRGADAALAGICSALVLWGVCAVLGVATVVQAQPWTYVVMKLVGASYLYWLGVQLVVRGIDDMASSSDGKDKPERSGGRFFGEGFLTSIMNPNVFLFYLAIFPQFLGEDSTALMDLALVSIYVGINAAWFTFVARMFERAGPRDIGTAMSRWAARAIGIFLMGFGLYFVFQL